jgi:hypothetical protein
MMFVAMYESATGPQRRKSMSGRMSAVGVSGRIILALSLAAHDRKRHLSIARTFEPASREAAALRCRPDFGIGERLDHCRDRIAAFSERGNDAVVADKRWRIYNSGKAMTFRNVGSRSLTERREEFAFTSLGGNPHEISAINPAADRLWQRDLCAGAQPSRGEEVKSFRSAVR